MKKYIYILTILFSLSLSAQDGFWYDVLLEVEGEDTNEFEKTVDEFYSSLDFPDDVTLSFSRIQIKGQGFEETHILSFLNNENLLFNWETIMVGVYSLIFQADKNKSGYGFHSLIIPKSFLKHVPAVNPGLGILHLGYLKLAKWIASKTFPPKLSLTRANWLATAKLIYL